MKDKKRIILCCICIVMLLIFTVVYAEETASTTDLIEYDVVYTVTTTDNITTLNATFTVMNSEIGTEEPLLIAAIYDDGRMVNMQTAQPSIASGATVNEVVSIVIPEDKSESYYIKMG